MDSGVILVILVLVGMVVGVNGALYLSLRRGKGGQHFKLWRNAAGRARNPWQQEEENLEALSQMVSELKKKDRPDQDS